MSAEYLPDDPSLVPDREAVRREAKAHAVDLILSPERRAQLRTLREQLAEAEAAAAKREAARFPERYLMATTAMHALGDISRDEPALAIVYGETDQDWIGEWATGLGMINVRFPKATTRELTAEERAFFSTKVLDTSGMVRPIVFPDSASGGGAR